MLFNDDDPRPPSGDVCVDAKSAYEACAVGVNAQDSGLSLGTTWPRAKCQQDGEEGKKRAQCVIDNKSTCICMAKCLLSGVCT